jgi:plasmid stabilization system protein ParE
MSRYQLTSAAFDDLFDVWSFIAQDSPAAADRVEQAIYRACERLAETPLIGSVRTDLTPLPVRFWVLTPYPNYLLVYEPEPRPIRILRILHRSRDIPSLLR